MPGATPLEFTAPNLQYLMDSPSEFGPVTIRAVHRRTRARSVSRSTTPAPTPSSTASSRTSRRSSARKARSTASIRSTSRGTTRSSPTTCRTPTATAWSTATARSSPRRARSPSSRDGSARHRRARVLPLLERRAHPAAGARAVRLRSRQHVRRALARRRVHAVLRPAGAAARAARRPRRRRPRTFGGLIESVARRPGHLVRSAEEMSRMAPFIDGGRTDRSHQLVDDGHFVLPVRRRDCAGARSDAARPHRRPAVARRLHARDVADATASRAAAARATSIIRTRSPTPRRRWPRSAATRRSRATSSRATSRGTRSPTTRGCWRAPASRCASATAGRAWLGDLRLESRERLARRRAGSADLADLRRRPRRRRRAAAGGRAADRRRRRCRDGGPAAQAGRHGADRRSSIAPAWRRPRASRWPRIRTSKSCRSKPAR